jgi:ABC-2 type transport system permease protein
LVGIRGAGVNGTGLSSQAVLGPLARAQYRAVAAMRWRMTVNTLRSTRGKFELGARIFATGFLSFVWLLAGTGCGFLAYRFTSDGNLALLPFLFWPVLLFWQLIPVMIASSQENVDLGFLLRFPIGFPSYSLLYLVLGIFDISSLAGAILLLGIWIGTVAAKPSLAGWMMLALALFALFNFVLSRMIFAWIDRWLAQRKTREILGIVSLVFFVGIQLLNPAYHPHSGHARSMNWPALIRTLKAVDRVQQFFPPGLAAKSIDAAEAGHPWLAEGLLSGVAAYTAIAGLLLGIRLRAEYRGENLGEAPLVAAKRRSRKPAAEAGEMKRRSSRGLFDGPVGGILAKELRTLTRSSVMLFSMFTPLIFLFLIGGTMRADHPSSMQYGFPIGVAYAFLPLTRQVCNSLGGEGAGIQLYFLSPTPFRTVMLSKNIFQLGLFLIELVLACSILIYRFGLPGPELALTTLCWLLFAVPANLAAGNILSITMAYRMTMTRVSREQGSVGNGLLSLLIQLLIFVVGAAIYVPLAFLEHKEFAAPILLLLAAVGVFVWRRGLSNVDRMAADRREALISVLTRQA